MKNLLTRKYPFAQSSHWLRDSVIYGLIIWAILYLLQPFGFSQYQGNKCLVAAAFGVVTMVCYVLYGYTVMRHLPKLVKTLRVWHDGAAVLGLILCIAIGNFLLLVTLFDMPVTLRLFLLFFWWTLIIGTVITAMSVGIEYNRYLKHQMEALLNNTAEEQRDITITIHDQNVRGNDLELPINNLLYIEAQKNNIAVCYLRDDKPTIIELHTTLSAAIDELRDYENIFQCHRSFVVNVNNITQAKGNSNGYQLRLTNSYTTIPVSRQYVPRLKDFIA
ncbi:MAG: LytTR family transcriptional regulator [Prevotella ruminicola]|jgi:hypothetical protein|uniref:LytTR family transcriptional regulator n=1 Tax=Xylanibacter ruminicola TaxID=839 RepID=A0A9D5P1A3_XYLRU|nr:LytTR family transcriptional regulator [Xylanibacter ruminicola]